MHSDSTKTEAVQHGSVSPHDSLPVIPLRDIVVFPRTMVPLFVGREKSLNAVEKVINEGAQIALIAQRDARVENPSEDDFFSIGTRGEIIQAANLPDGTVKMLVEGTGRIEAVHIHEKENTLWANVVDLPGMGDDGMEEKAMARQVINQFEEYLKFSQRIPPEVLTAVENAPDAGSMADTVAGNLSLKLVDKQSLLEHLDTGERLKSILEILNREIEVMSAEKNIRGRVKKRIERNQKEFYLTEQMKAIQEELGTADDLRSEVEELREKARKAKMPPQVAEKTEKEIRRLESMPPMSAEGTVVRNYVEWLVELPWTKRSRENLDIGHAQGVLNEDHFGLETVKERILEYLAVRQLVRKPRGPILCLAGPPGVGKTSLGRSIARATNRKFARISLGGVRDEAEIRGHRRTYIGSLPGRIIQSMHRVGTINPVLMLDEIDKSTSDFRGDPTSALLEVLDPEQNNTFSDHYLEVNYDLSQVFFIATANILDGIPPTLRDRLEIIRIPGYTSREKTSIANRFLLPKQIEQHGLKPEQIQVSRKTIERIQREYTSEAGVRNLEREIASLCRKVAKRVASRENKGKVRIHAGSLENFLGVPRHRTAQGIQTPEIGVATGLAWTQNGGELLLTEIGLMPGTGQLILTGKLGDVLKESARAAVSYVRSKAEELDLPRDFHKKQDIHIHVPEGATPKDGPSAGITMVVALISALSRRKVRKSICMTGEITLRGKILPVGGIKEKILAAHQADCETVFLPTENERDLKEIPPAIQRTIDIRLVNHVDEVLPIALMKKEKNFTKKKPEIRSKHQAERTEVSFPN